MVAVVAVTSNGRASCNLRCCDDRRHETALRRLGLEPRMWSSRARTVQARYIVETAVVCSSSRTALLLEFESPTTLHYSTTVSTLNF